MKGERKNCVIVWELKFKKTHIMVLEGHYALDLSGVSMYLTKSWY